MWRCVVLLSVGLLTACAGPDTLSPGISPEEIAAEQARQQYFQFQNFNTRAARLENVAFKILAANANDCGGNIIPKLGFRALAQGDTSETTRAAKTAALRLDAERPTVISVVEGGPAAKAGMLVGDVVIRVDGRMAPKTGWPSWLNTHVKTVGETRPIPIEVRRNGQSKILAVRPVFACNIPVELEQDNDLNAYTDSKKIVLNTGILRVAQNDPEIAVIVSHELAHVTMGHRRKKEQNEMVGMAVGFMADVAVAAAGVNTGGAGMKEGAAAGILAYSQDFEREADYVGSYYAARAGYEFAGESFWRAMAQENPQNIFLGGTHPTSPERILRMQKTRAEINEKMRLKQPLVPERKPLIVTQAPGEDAD
jgi:hypothetical protein